MVNKISQIERPSYAYDEVTEYLICLINPLPFNNSNANRTFFCNCCQMFFLFKNTNNRINSSTFRNVWNTTTAYVENSTKPRKSPLWPWLHDVLHMMEEAWRRETKWKKPETGGQYIGKCQHEWYTVVA